MCLGKFISVTFRLIMYALISINYYQVVILTWLPEVYKSSTALGFVLVYTSLVFMLMWSVVITNTTNPGTIPLYWGFYIGDAGEKKKRYCLMCNVFKPDRCHHCSVCNVCVLNMDHHCPWLNNCIGFFNRKFFMQMLFYMNITIILTVAINTNRAYHLTKNIYENKLKISSGINKDLAFLVLYFLDIVVLFILTSFFRFHLKIVLENKTTIETIDHKGQFFYSEYDNGSYANWVQVMGTNKLLWFFPLRRIYGLPTGNGIDWITNRTDTKKTDESNTNAGGTGNTRSNVPYHHHNNSVDSNSNLKVKNTPEIKEQIKLSSVNYMSKGSLKRDGSKSNSSNPSSDTTANSNSHMELSYKSKDLEKNLTGNNIR